LSANLAKEGKALMSEEIKIPSGVTLKVDGKRVVAKGPKGEVQRDFSHVASIGIGKSDNNLTIQTTSSRKRDRSLVMTLKTEIDNMLLGVTRGFTYKLKTCHSHFPITVKVDKDKHVVNIENFIGERYPRVATIAGNVDVSVKGDDVIISGADKEAIGQTSTNISRACRIREKDPRVFQDGIYLYESYCGDELLKKI
jgi:large subunit ribosomal protein L6